MAHGTEAGNSRIGTAAVTLIAAAAISWGCDMDDRDGLDEVPPEISAEQEQAMCDRLFGSASTGTLPKVAGDTIGAGGALDASTGKKTVDLIDFEGQKGGYIRLSINPENHTAVFLMHAQDVPFAAVRDDGSVVDYENAKEAVCTQAEGRRYLWVVRDSTNHLRFGPTSATTVDLVLEVVD